MDATIGVRNGRAAVFTPFLDALGEIVDAVFTGFMLLGPAHDRTFWITPLASVDGTAFPTVVDHQGMSPCTSSTFFSTSTSSGKKVSNSIGIK